MLIPIQPQADNWDEVRTKLRSKFGLNPQKYGVNFGVKSEKTLKLIFQDQSISAVAIAAKLGITPRTVEKQLAKMKALGIIKRVGADKGGHWAICL